MEDRPEWVPSGTRILEVRNGSAAPATERPNPLRRERWVDMGDMYPWHQLLIRFNPDRKGLETLPDDAPQEQKIIAGLKRIVLAHRIHVDGLPDTPWTDPDTDQPLPSPAADEFWELISNDILATIMAHIAADQKKVQASVERIFGGSIDTLSGAGLQSAADPNGSAGTTS